MQIEKKRLSREDHGIIKFTIYINDTDLFTKVSVCRAVFFPSTEKSGFKFLLLSDLSVLFDYFVSWQVIYMFHTFTNYTFCLKILLTDVTSSRVPICIRLVLSSKDN